MFPRRGPGMALVLLRLTVAATVCCGEPSKTVQAAHQWVSLGLIPLVLAVCVGLLTPIVAVACVVVEGVAAYFASDRKSVV